ncbi:ADP-ribose diphosphatase [Solemya pervernicosa gill symbiont]|uniref:ADP-ribose pyrophosphatase n=2 Tax=Gammaproteobacteria incertae sedis TaxID=118884 RepID=A0A1T2L2X0_9GAMM|nr:NUDIX domain-containing protein [Candidatus Reidiella endopervernicosa]OOZ39445.1 ADP-ribose diphosphatase [Solemya pervernicosa gill symbiont]QKQ26704.1 NUDIX domain-containing protein [Candidatus Reidiella endopervernicosa]
MKKEFEVVEKRVLYDGFFKLEGYRLKHTLFEGGWSRELYRELLERGHAAAVLLYDPKLDSVVLIEQFRIGALNAPNGPWLMEVVAGMVEPGEPVEELVKREAEEEAGCKVEELETICDYFVSPGGASEIISLFCGRVDASGAGGVYGLEHEGEDICALVVDFDEAMEWLKQGKIDSASPIIAMQWLALNREALRERWLRDR